MDTAYVVKKLLLLFFPFTHKVSLLVNSLLHILSSSWPIVPPIRASMRSLCSLSHTHTVCYNVPFDWLLYRESGIGLHEQIHRSPHLLDPCSYLPLIP